MHNKEQNFLKKYNIKIIKIKDKSYPDILKQIYSPPPLLYVRGKILKNDEFAVAIVGSRFASTYGVITAERLGYELASKGIVVVSGLARGIDSAAHKGALKAYGRTIAVLGSGLKNMYPPENKKLAEDIVEKEGAVISEFPVNTAPIGRNFPQRNRVISGLSLAVIVVEAAKNSGALITADFAIQQNREVFAVPGKIDSATSFGTNELIKDGAKLVQTADDVIDELKLKLKPSPSCCKEILRSKEGLGLKPVLSTEEESVYENLSTEPKYLDDVVHGARMPLNKTVELLFRLQLKKLVKELPGKNFIKV